MRKIGEATSGAVESERDLRQQKARAPESTVWLDDDYKQARDDNDILGRDPTGPLAPLGGQSPYSIYPPRKWERPRSRSQYLLQDLLLNLLLNPPHPESINLQLPRSGL